MPIIIDGSDMKKPMVAWVAGRLTWQQLTPEQRLWIRQHIVEYANSNKALFSIEIKDKTTAQEIIRSVNRPTGPEGDETDGGNDRPGDERPGGNTGGKVNLLPGKKGVDYEIWKYNGKIYAVYGVKLATGKTIYLSWGISNEECRSLGISPEKVRQAPSSAHSQWEYWGPISQILSKRRGAEHPLETALREIYEQFGRKVSWVTDPEVMQVHMMAELEGWSAEEVMNRLKRTKWWQSRTEAQRKWEMDTAKADKKASIASWATRLQTAIEDLYGENFTWDEIGISQKELQQHAEDIASGKYGYPEEGFERVMDDLRRDAEKIEGSMAWIERQQEIQSQNEFLNEPEDMYERLRTDALEWLGPAWKSTPMLSRDTLSKWSQQMVSGVKSDADWEQFLRQTAKAIYPWLPPNTPWQQAVDPYRSMAENIWGRPVEWGNRILQKVATTPEGEAAGALVDFGTWETILRQAPEFWSGPVARDEGFDLISRLNEMFYGVESAF